MRHLRTDGHIVPFIAANSFRPARGITKRHRERRPSNCVSDGARWRASALAEMFDGLRAGMFLVYDAVIKNHYARAILSIIRLPDILE
jgi:hypothetical protein